VPRTADGLCAALGEADRRYTRHVNFREGWRVQIKVMIFLNMFVALLAFYQFWHRVAVIDLFPIESLPYNLIGPEFAILIFLICLKNLSVYLRFENKPIRTVWMMGLLLTLVSVILSQFWGNTGLKSTISYILYPSLFLLMLAKVHSRKYITDADASSTNLGHILISIVFSMIIGFTFWYLIYYVIQIRHSVDFDVLSMIKTLFGAVLPTAFVVAHTSHRSAPRPAI
jgi:hypothetical protein